MVRILTPAEYDSMVDEMAAEAYQKVCEHPDINHYDSDSLRDNITTVRSEIVDAVEYSGEFGELGWHRTTESPSMAFYGSIIDNHNGSYLHSELQELVDARLRDKYLTKKEAMRYLVADVKEQTNQRLRAHFKDDDE